MPAAIAAAVPHRIEMRNPLMFHLLFIHHCCLLRAAYIHACRIRFVSAIHYYYFMMRHAVCS